MMALHNFKNISNLCLLKLENRKCNVLHSIYNIFPKSDDKKYKEHFIQTFPVIVFAEQFSQLVLQKCFNF